MIETGAVNSQALEYPSARRKFLIGGAVLAVAVVYLIFTAARGSTAFYLTVEELRAQGPSPQIVRVAGTIVGESIDWTPRNLLLKFKVADQSGTLPVVYHGSRPDMFRDGAEIVLEGQYSSQGTFEAGTMLLKCPSKYEEAG